MLARPTVVLTLCFLGAQCAPSQDRPPGTNRLIHESSPYLLLHAHNPVDWYPWGEEAIELARKLDRPIFLSIGYSTCYWCHRMAADVFENPAIAALMNAGFVNIKVDREERPDLDEIYMTATQLMTRSGGWPNSIFLTPDLKPFFSGTYFPPEDRGNAVGFPTILRRIQDLWTSDRARVEESASQVAKGLEEVIAARSEPAAEPPDALSVKSSFEALARRYDEEWGGFGGAPKFPSPANLYFLQSRAEEGSAEARRMLVETLHHMGEGAIYDQLGGGFHRYATDREWRVPHFEKMLYDNAALAEILVRARRTTNDPDLERLARGTLDFLLNNLTGPSGGFLSAIDAQTEGREGAYYVWTREEIRDLLTSEEYALVAPLFGIDQKPNFEENEHTLYLTTSLADYAKRSSTTREALLSRLEPALQKLRAARSARKFPLVDDKVLTDWNGMAIAAMAEAGAAFAEPRYREAAEKDASFLLAELWSAKRPLQHVWREGKGRVDAFLDDYAFLMKGLLVLHRATGDAKWLEATERLAEEMESRLRDPKGGYFQSAPVAYLLFQSKSSSDGAIPAANAVAIEALLELSELTGKPVYRARAEAGLKAFANDLTQYPAGSLTLALAVERFRGDPGERATRARAVPEKPPTEVAGLAETIVEARVAISEALPSPESSWIPFRVTLRIREGWHVNANPPSSPYLIPTAIEGDVRKLVYPRGKTVTFAFSAEPLSVYDGEVVVEGQWKRDSPTPSLVYQACDDSRCLSSVTRPLGVKP
jgi:uncharacterized protein